MGIVLLSQTKIVSKVIQWKLAQESKVDMVQGRLVPSDVIFQCGQSRGEHISGYGHCGVGGVQDSILYDYLTLIQYPWVNHSCKQTGKNDCFCNAWTIFSNKLFKKTIVGYNWERVWEVQVWNFFTFLHFWAVGKVTIGNLSY